MLKCKKTYNVYFMIGWLDLKIKRKLMQKMKSMMKINSILVLIINDIIIY